MAEPRQPAAPDHLAAVADLARDLLALRAPREISRTMFERLVPQADLDVCLIHVVAGLGSLQLDSWFGIGDDVSADIQAGRTRDAVSSAVAAERAPVVVEDVQRSADPRASLARSLGLQVYAGYPLLADGRLVGTVGFGSRRRPRFEPAQTLLLRTAADLTALALHRAALDSELQDERGARARTEQDRAGSATREQQARSEAEAADRARDDFLSVLSHELRTPLNVTLGWVRMLRSGHLDDTQRAQALEVLERSIRAQTELIDELDVSRIISGKHALDMRPLDLLSVVRAALETVLPSAEAKGLVVRPGVGGAAIPMVGDAARLQQAVLGLLRNAVKFTPAGGAITVRLERTDDRVRLTISDTGEGIAPDLLPRIFDRNRPPDSSTTRTHGGLGLGLTIVRRLFELHGGSVKAESAGTRRGATFVVELPLNRADKPSAPAKAAEPVGDRLDGFRVLVVDDDEDTRDLMRVVLTEHGATVAAVESVSEALRSLGRFAPDVVLCDISMPGEDGFRLLEWIKEDERRHSRSIPVIALTARARPDDRHRILTAGFKEYVAKPLEISDVVGAVLRVAGRSPNR